MKPFYSFSLISIVILLMVSCSFQPRAEWVTTTESASWVEQPDILSALLDTIPTIDVTICTDEPRQQIDGFGACFNELGWLSLSRLDPNIREDIMQELFFPGEGANFSICRMPLGANDFSRDWYSYNETEGDFAMEHFTIANDRQTLIPFIRNARKYQPDLQLWASPWCPPSWMKYNKHYASAYNGDTSEEKYRNGLPVDKAGSEGTDMFIQDSLYLQAYALYFSKFIDAYKEQGIPIFAVMPQNEFNSAQTFPSCCWTAKGLARFIGEYLGPEMEKKDVEVMFGTMERANELLVDSILTDSLCSKYVKGVGFQWAGKGAIPGIHKRYPDMKLYQTEQECGNGKNDWKGAMYSWSLMQHYLNNGASAYMYWNISLDEGGISRWGWAQNSLVVVDPETKTFRYTPEYYVMKHVSHYVQPGARMLTTEGTYTNLMAFRNPDKSLVVIIANETDTDKPVSIRVEERIYRPLLPAHSISTLLID
ncbi:glycoside hydrolase family 30 protein [Parabacteroides bouchesdurhonensis]|uniref:glycoside hydrolase family 30 protein n=1 Tax=Parabacteroides bouchesdurhonensis TaxID=1936995 RepID=UPI000E512ABE|nr:glycoside hydrolase family 30 protein [Parabacteroides bouchesdurhonensis]RHJ93471.1 beta-glycosidase [Bacteroides sp. AM07-16]